MELTKDESARLLHYGNENRNFRIYQLCTKCKYQYGEEYSSVILDTSKPTLKPKIFSAVLPQTQFVHRRPIKARLNVSYMVVQQ